MFAVTGLIISDFLFYFYDLINRSGVVTHGQLPLVDNLRFVGGIKNEINAAAQSVVVSTRQAVGLS